MDPKSESRYGESKSYDPSLTIFADLLPHVISILGTLTNCKIIKDERLKFSRGGADLDVDIMLGRTPCAIKLVRNGSCRQRLIEVITEHETFTLDFSNEPGTITSGSKIFSADPSWDVKVKPVSRMLQAFLHGAAGGFRDKRLDITIGLRANDIIEKISSLYYAALFPWLIEHVLVSQYGDDSDLHYALTEILHADDPHSAIPMDKRIDYVYRYIKNNVNSSVSNDQSIEQPVEFVSGILKKAKLTSYC